MRLEQCIVGQRIKTRQNNTLTGLGSIVSVDPVTCPLPFPVGVELDGRRERYYFKPEEIELV